MFSVFVSNALWYNKCRYFHLIGFACSSLKEIIFIFDIHIFEGQTRTMASMASSWPRFASCFFCLPWPSRLQWMKTFRGWMNTNSMRKVKATSTWNKINKIHSIRPPQFSRHTSSEQYKFVLKMFSHIKRVSIQGFFYQSEVGVLEEVEERGQTRHRPVQLTEVACWKPAVETERGDVFWLFSFKRMHSKIITTSPLIHLNVLLLCIM